MLKLRTMVKDRITGLSGMLTGAEISGDGHCFYTFQPAKLNTKGVPVDRLGLTEDRIEGGEQSSTPIPLEIIGSSVRDTVTGFSGKVSTLVMHMHGCLHARVQGDAPREDGSISDTQEFDLRILEGPMLKKMDEPELEKSKQHQPSPTVIARQQMPEQAPLLRR